MVHFYCKGAMSAKFRKGKKILRPLDPCSTSQVFSPHALPLTSYLLPLTSYLLPLTSYYLPLTTYDYYPSYEAPPITDYPITDYPQTHSAYSTAIRLIRSSNFSDVSFSRIPSTIIGKPKGVGLSGVVKIIFCDPIRSRALRRRASSN